MDITFSHHRPRVERLRPDVAIGWTVRVTISDGETSIFDDITVTCSEMALDPPPRRVDVDRALRYRLIADHDTVVRIDGREIHCMAGTPCHPHLMKLRDLFEDRRRFAEVINFPLAED